jgi:iodotyrosine deiodinase
MTMAPSLYTSLPDYREYPVKEMQARAAAYYAKMNRRRTVREFSDQPVPREIIENCIRTAATAPSGANQQPWTFVAVSDPVVKSRIRKAAEKVEQKFYTGEATKKWVEDLAPLGTHASKPFLETAPYLIVIFAQRYGRAPDGGKVKHYYVQESVGIATGLLVSAVHNAGLVSLTYTPANMSFLNRILERPENEKPFLILVTGYPAKQAALPDISRKKLAELATFI